MTSKFGISAFLTAVAAAGALASSTQAYAATAFCPALNGNPFDRNFVVTTNTSAAVTCAGYGNNVATAGNIATIIPGYNLIDLDSFPSVSLLDPSASSSSDNGFRVTNNLFGDETFSLSGTFGTFARLALVLQATTSLVNPDYAVFTFAPGVTGGTFDMTNVGTFTTVSLYGLPTPVPGPLAGAGVPALLGFAGLLFARVRRSRRSAA